MTYQCVTGVFPTETKRRFRMRLVQSLIARERKINDLPPQKASAAQSDKAGGAANKPKAKKVDQRAAYRPRPFLVQVGRATR
jgi:hypothetical protein